MRRGRGRRGERMTGRALRHPAPAPAKSTRTTAIERRFIDCLRACRTLAGYRYRARRARRARRRARRGAGPRRPRGRPAGAGLERALRRGVGMRVLHVGEESGHQRLRGAPPVGERVDVDRVVVLPQRLHEPLVLEPGHVVHEEVLLVGGHELVGDVEGHSGRVRRDVHPGRVAVDAAQPPLVPLGPHHGRHGEQAAELLVIGVRDLEDRARASGRTKLRRRTWNRVRSSGFARS